MTTAKTARQVLDEMGFLGTAEALRDRFGATLLYVADNDGNEIGSLAALGDGPESDRELGRRVIKAAMEKK